MALNRGDSAFLCKRIFRQKSSLKGVLESEWSFPNCPEAMFRILLPIKLRSINYPYPSVTDQGSWTFSSIEIDETRQEIQARLYWGSRCSRGERKQVTGALARSLRGRWAGPLNGVKVEVGPGVGPRDGWGGLPAPRWWCVQGACAEPRFCSLLLRSSSWVFGHFGSCSQFAPTAHACSYF